MTQNPGGTRVLLSLLCLLILWQAVPARGDLLAPLPKQPHWRLNNTVGFGWNPLVGGIITYPYFYLPIGHSDGLLWGSNNFRAGPISTFCPAFEKAGAKVGITPIAALDLDVTYYGIADWQAVYFESLKDRYGEGYRATRPKKLMTGQQVMFSATVKAKAGPVVFLSFNDLEYWAVPDFYWSIELATIIKKGWDFRNKNFLGYLANDDILFFVNYEWFKVYNTDYETDLISVGLFTDKLVPRSMTLIQIGYHLKNKDFSGVKVLMGVVTDFAISKLKEEKPKAQPSL